MIAFYLSIVETDHGQHLFETIYYSCRSQMFTVADRVLQDPQLAEDAVQEALLGIAKTVDKVTFPTEQTMRSYALTAARHAALQIKEKEEKQRERTTALQYIAPTFEADVAEQLERKDALSALIQAILKLPQIYQDVLYYSTVHDMDYASMAKLMRLSPVAIRQRVSRARKMLTDICRKESIELEL